MRDILHCDLNNFFASVEILNRPELKNVPMAVCGDPNIRHGIILAKNEIAKKYGIVTAETVYSAKKKCPQIILVSPSYDKYIKYSKIVNKIYLKYTDRVEPFGIDESFLDVTESKKLFGNPYEIAFKIKEEVKEKTGLTISIGVSFTKSLAKLGSDLKKPDDITVLDIKDYKKKIYDLPVNMLLYVGKNTSKVLNKIGIYTIGDLALYDKKKIIKYLGKNGEMIHNFANGIDNNIVEKYDKVVLPKSISKGRTFSSDISNLELLNKNITSIVNEVVYQLKKYDMMAKDVGIVIKSSGFKSISRQKKIERTDNFKDINNTVHEIFLKNYSGKYMIRSITVYLKDLELKNENYQISIFDNQNENMKLKKVNSIMDKINEKYKSNIVHFYN